MKNDKNTLIGLYFNLFMVVLSLIFSLRGLIHGNTGNWLKWILILALIISEIFNIVFAGINTASSFILLKNSDYNSMRKNMKALKFGVIPYFVINFIIYSLLFLLFFAGSRGLIVFTPIPLLFLIPVFLHTLQ